MISITVCYCNSTASLLVFSTDMAVATAVEIQGVMKKKQPKTSCILTGEIPQTYPYICSVRFCQDGYFD